MAAYNGHESIVSLLLSRGADINARNNVIIIYLFISLSHIFRMDILLLYGPPIMAMNQLCLFFSLEELTSMRGNNVIISYLLYCSLSHIIRVDLLLLYGPPRNGHESIVSLLLSRGADINAMDNVIIIYSGFLFVSSL